MGLYIYIASSQGRDLTVVFLVDKAYIFSEKSTE